MDFVWDEKKNEWLKAERFVSFEEISKHILEGDYTDIVKHPSRAKQRYFVLHIREYTWLVPFLIDEQRRIVLKTAFPSRKYHKKYGDT
ncbi:MAG: toxin [Spirochaetes bacterium]|jgi:uncharacterized DUF497 family protein|nr:toxin [Spirochaetota bacterium]